MSGADDQRVCGAGVDRPFRRAGNCYLHNRSLGECLPHTEGPAGAAFPARSVHSVVRLRGVLPFRHDDAVGLLHSGIDSPGPISAGREAVPEKDGQRLSVSHCSVVLTNPGRVVADHRYFVCGDAVFVPRGADFDSDELRHVSFRAKPHSHTARHCRAARRYESVGGGVDCLDRCRSLPGNPSGRYRLFHPRDDAVAIDIGIYGFRPIGRNRSGQAQFGRRYARPAD